VTARFFVDETDLALGKALREIHNDVVYPGHVDLPEIPRGALDDDWLPVVALSHLVVITRDQRIRYRPVEKRLWMEHKVRGFVLTGRRSQSTLDSLAVLEQHGPTSNRSSTPRLTDRGCTRSPPVHYAR
jgi:PIN like domain